MDSLAKEDNLKAVRRALAALPRGLDATYDEAMRRIRGQNHAEARRAEQVLSWISYALRPLTLIEIQHALAVEPEDADFDEDAAPYEGVLVSVCAGLVTIDRESNIIRLVHYTTQEYFERNRATWFPCAQTSIARTCLIYISFDVFAEGHCRSDRELEIRMQKYALLEYAARHWGDHARGEREEAVKELVLKFLEQDSKLMCSNQVTHLSAYRYSGYSQSFPRHITGLYLAASIGLVKIVRLLLDRKGVEVNSKDSGGQTPLSKAAEKGREAVVRLLVETAGVDLNSKDYNGRTPLLWATENGHLGIVKLLASKGVNLDFKDIHGQAPLFCASRNGHLDIVKLLIEKKVDLDPKDLRSQTPLSCAARNGHKDIAKLLAEKVADLNPKDSNSQTPLLWAARNGHLSIVKLLAEKGVDLDSGDFNGQTPLLCAARNGHLDIVKLLAAKEVNLDSKDSHGQTPLSCAARNGHIDIVKQ